MNIGNIMRKVIHEPYWVIQIKFWLVPKGDSLLSPWNKGMVKLNKIQKDQKSVFSIAKTSETYKNSCFMGTLSKALPKSILKSQNPLTYGNHYVCSAVYLAQLFLLPSLKESISEALHLPYFTRST